MSSLNRLGWNSFFEAQASQVERTDLGFARVVEEQRGAYRVAGAYDGWAEISGRLRHDVAAAGDFPTVGDWVGITIPGRESTALSLDRAVIHARLARKSVISRAAAGRATAEQVLAANVDTAFLVTALTDDLNPRRLERYLTMVLDAGVIPVVLLNKADLCADPMAACESVRGRLPFIDVLALSALEQPATEIVEALSPFLRPAQTVVLLGSSGVGKSTLINGLLGAEAQRVSQLAADGRGRHTTTARQLIELPGGALLIDTPGLREVQPWASETAVDFAFDDIAALARHCRFADCAHATEPGCGVLAAVETGRLDADRLEHYRRLLREAAFEERKRDKAAGLEQKRYWKRMHKAAKALYRDRERGRG